MKFLIDEAELHQNGVFFWSLCFLPIAVIIFLAWFFFIPLPIYDYWDVLYGGLQLRGKTALEQLQFYWQPFVDQKMVFPKLFIICLAKVTNNNHYWLEIIFGLFGQLSVLSIVVYLIVKTRSLSPRSRSVLILTSSFLLFWPNLLVRFQHHWYSTQYTFVLLFAALSILSIVRFWGTWTGVCLSLILGVFSAISHGTGLIYLLSYLVLLTLASGWSISQKLFSAGGALGTILLIAAQMPDRAVINLPPLNWFTEKPFQELIFILRCFGPEGVLRTQTGFLTLVLGLYSCGVLYVKREIFSREYFAWVLIFFWGCCAAGISGITRSSFAKYPQGIYFSFFILVMIAAVVLTVVAYPKSPLKDKKINWKIVGTILVILYIVGSVEGIRQAVKNQKRVFWSRERLQFHPILIQSDYRWLFPAKRIKRTLSQLSASGMLEEVDARPFTINRQVHFRKQTEDQGVHYYTPDRALSPDEVITFPANAFSNYPARCYWTAGSKWHEEQSQDLQLRLVNGKYWIIFRNREIPGYNEPVNKIKLILTGDHGSQDISNLPLPTVWQRKTTSE